MKSLIIIAVFLVITVVSNTPASAQQTEQNRAVEDCAFPLHKSSEVDRKLRILSKPEPAFSRHERNLNARARIMLTAIFCGSGEVTNIRVKSGLSDSVNAKAIEAARKIRFVPGEKDGQRVSQLLTLVYYVGRD